VSSAFNDIQKIVTDVIHVSSRVRLAVKIRDEYRDFKELPPALLSQQGPVGPSRPLPSRKMITSGGMSNSQNYIPTLNLPCVFSRRS